MRRREVDSEQLRRWYEVKEVAEDVWAIGEPFHDEEVFSYLVLGTKRDLLFDTGMGVKSIKLEIEKIRDGKKELVVVNSHSHFDHIGGNSEFDLVLVPGNDWENENIRRGWGTKALEEYNFASGFSYGVPGGVEPSELRIGGYFHGEPVLGEGSVLDLGNRQLKVIETPGHTPGGICLWDEENRALFSSDLVYDGPLYCFADESNLNQYWNSLVKLQYLVLKGATVFPGHNYSKNGADLVGKALSLFERCLRGDHPDSSEDGRAVYGISNEERLRLIV